MTTSHDPHINKAAPFNHPQPPPKQQQQCGHLISPTDEQLQQVASHLTSPMDECWWWLASHLTSPMDTATTDGKPPHQPNRQTTMMDSEWMCHNVQMVMTHVIITVCKFRWAPWLPSLSPLFTWEPRGHVTIGNVATNSRFTFANYIAH